MANDIDSDAVGHAKAQFDVAFKRLEGAQQRLQALAANPGNDFAELETARSAYDQARLLWLSSEAALRSAALVDGHHHYANWHIVILQGNSHVAESIALLLRLRGFRTTVLSRHPAGENKTVEPTATIIVDFERRRDPADELAISRLRTAPSTRVVAMVPSALRNEDWVGFDAVLLKPASIDMIVQVILGHRHA